MAPTPPPDEHWDVWFDWYGGVLRGSAETWESARPYIDWPEEFWEGTPADINRAIKERLAKEGGADTSREGIERAREIVRANSAFDYRFDGRQIVATPKTVAPRDTKAAETLRAELLNEASVVREDLITTNAPRRPIGGIDRFVQAISTNEINPILVRSRLRTLEGTLREYARDEYRMEFGPDALIALGALVENGRDYLALVEVPAPTLPAPSPPSPQAVEAIVEATKRVTEIVEDSPVVAPSAKTAQETFIEALAEEPDPKVKAEIAKDEAINVVGLAVAVTDAVAAAPPEKVEEAAGALAVVKRELGDLGGLSWQAVKEGLPTGVRGTTAILPFVGLMLLAAQINPWLAPLVLALSPVALKPLMTELAKVTDKVDRAAKKAGKGRKPGASTEEGAATENKPKPRAKRKTSKPKAS